MSLMNPPGSLLNSQSAQNNESQLTEPQIEEKIFKKYNKFKEELEQKTQQGFCEREDVIRRGEQKLKDIKREKERIAKKLREYEERKGGMEQEREDLQKQLNAIKKETKLGEELMRRQV